jgi:streptogramin lyase
LSDLERELLELKERVSESIKPSPEMADRVFRRARVRRILTAATGVFVASALMVASLAVVRGLTPPTSQAPIAPQPSPESPADSSPHPAERGSVFDVAFSDGAVWALTCDTKCSGDQRDSTGSVLRIDPDSEEAVASVKLAKPTAITVGEGSVWVLSFWDGTVTRIDPATSQVVAIIKLTLPFAVCETCPDPRDFLPSDVAAGEGAVWVTTARGVLARIDSTTNEVSGMIRLPEDTTGEVAVGDDAVWVTENVLGVYRIDPGTNEITAKIVVDDKGQRVAIDRLAVAGGAVFAEGDSVSGAVIARIDPATDQAVALFSIGEVPRLIAFDSGALWLWEFRGTSLERIDPENGSATATVDAPAGGHFVAVGGGSGWAAMPDGRLTKVDLPSG